MVAPVVLHGKLDLGIAQVKSHQQQTVRIADLAVDLGFRQTSEHQQHPQPCLHRRLDALPDVRRCLARGLRMPPRVSRAVVDQLPKRESPLAHQPVTDHHQVDEIEHGGELDEHARGCRDGHVRQHPNLLRTQRRQMTPHTAPSPTLVPPRDGHMLV